MSSVALPVSPRRNRLLGTPADVLTLRVLNQEHYGRELSLRGAKCTVGSAPGCTLRLRSAGIGPLHCLILRGPGGTIVRRRSSRTLLNGAPFDDAPLRPGDRLQVGPVKLEVVACSVLDEAWQAGAAELPPLAALARERDQLESAAAAAEREAASLRTRIAAVESQSAGRAAELSAQVAELAAQREALSARLESAELLAAERGALLSERTALAETLAAGQAELAAMKSHLAARENEIEGLLQEETRRVSEIQDRLEDALRERQTLESRLREQADALREEAASRELERERLIGECERLDDELNKLRELVGYTAAERDQLTLQRGQEQERLAGELRNVRELQGEIAQVHRERTQLQERLDSVQTQLAAAQQQFAVLQVEGNHHLPGETEQTAELRRLLEQAEFAKSEHCEQAQAAQARLAEIERRADLADEWQRQATDANDRVVFLQEQLADVELRLETAATEFQSELAAARQSAAEWEGKSAELQVQQSAALAQLAYLEAREAEWLAATAQPDASAEVGAWQARAAAAESQQQQLLAQLDELSEKVRFERETWHTDRERLHQECRMLGQRLIQQQRELDAAQSDLHELRQSSSADLPGQTITMDQFGQLMGETGDDEPAIDPEQMAHEREAWEAERQELTSQIERLRRELEDLAAAAYSAEAEATLDAEAAAALKPNALAAELAEQLARLEAEQAQETARRQEAEAAAAEAAAAREQAEMSLTEARTQLAETDGLRQQVVDLEGQRAAERSAAASANERLAALETELAERQTALAQLQEQLAAATEAQDREPSEAPAERARLEQDLLEREQAIERQAAELSHRLALADERLAAAESLRSELERERESLAQQEAMLARQSAPLAAMASPGDDLQTPESSTPLALAAQVNHRGEDGEAPAPRDSVSLGNLAEQKPVWMQAQAPAPPADDDSIEDYMSRLLRRVRGEGPPPAVPYQFPAQAAAHPPSEPSAASPPPAHVDAASPEAEAATPYRPRATAPELSTDLKAMRELANSACRTAIAKHQKHRGGREVLGQLVGVSLALLISGVAAGMAIALKSWPAGFAALAGFVAVTYWTLRVIVRALQIMRLSSLAVGDAEPEDAAPQDAASMPDPEAEIGALDPRADDRLDAAVTAALDSPPSTGELEGAAAVATASPPASESGSDTAAARS